MLGIKWLTRVTLALMATAGAWASEAGLDASIQPGDDFFAYANGRWLQDTEIPAGKERLNARAEIDELTRQQLTQVLDAAAVAPMGSAARKVADFRAAYLNEAAIEASGTTALKPLLKRIDGVRDKVALTRLLGAMLRADVDPLSAGVYESAHLLGLAVGPGIHGERTNVAFLAQGGLGLPNREYYLGDAQAARSKYQTCIGRTLELAGFHQGDQRAAAVMALETAIARSHATPSESANDQNADNLWTRADFLSQAPGMDWSAFFDAAGLSTQEVFVVWQPGAVKGAAALVGSQPLQAWQDFLRFHLIYTHADVLPRAFTEQSCAPEQKRSRAQRAREATEQMMSGALGRLYAERYFPAELKTRVDTIATHVIAVFRERVAAVPWLSPASRSHALAKLQTLYFGVGYPETWPDYSGLTVSPTDAAGNLLRVSEWKYRNALARLGQPVDPREWRIEPHTVGAVLVFEQNAYNFPAAFLQAPKFDATASDAANYGAIGAIIGHEVSHFVDTLGADYDAEGRKTHWWTADDAARFDLAARPLVEQFSRYRPFPDMALNGRLTRTENVADLAGLTAAFEAYRRTLGARADDKDYVREQDRQFFLGFARSWRSKTREEALRAQVATNDHAPESYRIATVRNLDAWYDAFDVRPGQRLYLEPKERVRIW